MLLKKLRCVFRTSITYMNAYYTINCINKKTSTYPVLNGLISQCLVSGKIQVSVLQLTGLLECWYAYVRKKTGFPFLLLLFNARKSFFRDTFVVSTRLRNTLFGGRHLKLISKLDCFTITTIMCR